MYFVEVINYYLTNLVLPLLACIFIIALIRYLWIKAK